MFRSFLKSLAAMRALRSDAEKKIEAKGREAVKKFFIDGMDGTESCCCVCHSLEQILRKRLRHVHPSHCADCSIDDPFLKNISSVRDEAAKSTHHRLSYDDGWVKTHVDFAITDEEMAAAPHKGVFFAERRGEAREKLKNAVACLKRLLPPRPQPKYWYANVSSMYVVQNPVRAASNYTEIGLAKK